MSGCIHMNPMDWCIYCAPEIADLRERAEKAERERDTLASQLSDSQAENARLREALSRMERKAIDAAKERDEALAARDRAQAGESDLRAGVSAAFRKHGLAAGPEAVDMLVRDRDKFASDAVALEHQWSGTNAELEEAREDIKALAEALLALNSGADWPVQVTERIRDRRLLEVGDGV